jgi:hypothetical protein
VKSPFVNQFRLKFEEKNYFEEQVTENRRVGNMKMGLATVSDGVSVGHYLGDLALYSVELRDYSQKKNEFERILLKEVVAQRKRYTGGTKKES